MADPKKKTLGESIGYPGSGQDAQDQGPSAWDKLKASLFAPKQVAADPVPSPSPSPSPSPMDQMFPIDPDKARKLMKGFNGQ